MTRRFSYALVHKRYNCIECSVGFKIKGGNSVNDAKIQQNALDFKCELSFNECIISLNRHIKTLKIRKIKMCTLILGILHFK